MVPGPVATLEALLGHITEHLLQLLGGGRGAGKEETRGFQQSNRSCMIGRKIAAVEREAGPHVRVCVHEGHKGRGSVVRCRPTD